MVCSTVAPGTYTVYAPDTSNYAAYYQYSGNVQQSPTQSYMLHNHGGQSPNSGDDDNGGALGHTARASPATVTWLLDNYETADGTSLPRCTLYDHYKRHCQENRLDPVNAASFGKLIRSVFLGLRTRRLGTRGNSKYHYYGIRIKADSSLNRQGVVVSPTEPDPYADSVNTVVANSRQYSTHATKRHGPPSISSSSNSASPTYSSPVTQDVMPRYRNNGTTSEDRASLGDGEIPAVDFHSIEGFEETLVKLGMDMSHVEKFVSCYQQNCHNVLHFVKQLQFEEIEECWFSFWQAEYDELDDEDFMPERLSQQQLYALCSLAPTQDYIIEMDLAFYQTVVDVLVPSVLMSKMTPVLTQHCRNFAKNADMYLRKAMQGAPENLLRKKLQTVKYLAQGLKRYTSLNHLAQAARAVLQKQDQVSAMYNDYTRVDMTQVHEQAGWVCGCDQLMVQHINNAFRSNLQKMVPMEQWAEWLESIVDQTLAKYHDKPVEVITDVGKQFLLNWSFYTSMVIRDLTLRSAASFGSFHLIRLLADDYMFYLIESRIAKAGNQPLITVIRQEKDYPLFDDIRIPHPVIHHDEFIVTAPPVFDHKFQPTVHHDTDGFEVKRMRYHENRENVQVEVVEEVDGQNILCI
ncbi:unnamed protein product [Caenorhabditis auriculariae]|uniref:RFX-type winged-helix domain-containing protein n=1 Tax=Caenorhabditis auriculariae TaxID=2777116 RepID=A0A8S1H852_9PELO|nr:unnamed protein product [Caenorhabditis auriculariae]